MKQFLRLEIFLRNSATLFGAHNLNSPPKNGTTERETKTPSKAVKEETELDKKKSMNSNCMDELSRKV